MKLITLLIALAISTNAAAWGDKEQGLLTGAAAMGIGSWVYDKLSDRPAQNYRGAQYQAPRRLPPQDQGEYPYPTQPAPVVQTPAYAPIYHRTPSGYVEACQWPGQEIAVMDARMVVRGFRTCQ